MLGPLFLLLSKFAFAVLKALKFHQHSRIGLIIIISFWKMPSGSFKDRIVLQFLIHYWLLLQNRNMICFYILFLCTETVLTFLILMIFLQIPCGFLNTMLYMNADSFIYPLLMQLFHFLCNYFMQNFPFFLNRGDEISFRKDWTCTTNRILALASDTFSLSIEGSFLLHVLLYLFGRLFVLASDFCDYIKGVRLFLSIVNIVLTSADSSLLPVSFTMRAACYLEIHCLISTESWNSPTADCWQSLKLFHCSWRSLFACSSNLIFL